MQHTQYAVVIQRFYKTTYNKLSSIEREMMLPQAWRREDIRVQRIREWEEMVAQVRAGILLMQELPLWTPKMFGSFTHAPGYADVKTALKNSHLYVLSYASRGNLCNTIPNLNPEQKINIAYQLLAAVEYMHSKGIAHLDLKPENILLCEDLKVQITDFGFAQRATEPITQVRGSYPYQAPEFSLEKSGKDSIYADLWSLGSTLYFLFCQELLKQPKKDGKAPLRTFDEKRGGRINNQQFVDDKLLSPLIPEEWRPVLFKLLRMNPEERQFSFPIQ